jgi:alkanesulfonate monooxygenase SsuD/methylene tetrahydromethanopterin reductase-like flavin-dependent oxidoreductase (luciferase family)
MTYCAKTDAEARKIAQESFTYYMAKSLEHFLNWGEGDPPPGYEWYAKATKSPDLAAHMTFDYLFENGMILCGSPDTICTEIARWNDVGMSQVLMGKQIYRIAHEDTIKSIRLLGEAVLPQVRELVPPMPEVTGVPVIP